MGPTALRPIRRTKQWLSVLLKDTSVTAGDSNPHSQGAEIANSPPSPGLPDLHPGYSFFQFDSGLEGKIMQISILQTDGYCKICALTQNIMCFSSYQNLTRATIKYA